MKVNTNLLIKEANELHSHLIWEWRNDKKTRSLSRSGRKISWAEHQKWFKKILTSKNSFLYIGISDKSNNEKPIGVIRFDSIDFDKNHYEVSINIAPKSRGKGFGKLLLKAGTNKFKNDVFKCNRIYAEVISNNLTSANLFSAAGYSLQNSSKDGLLLYYLDLK